MKKKVSKNIDFFSLWGVNLIMVTYYTIFFSIFSPLCFIVRALAHNNMFHYVKIVCKENASSDNSCSTMRTTLNHQNSVLHFFVFLDYFLSFRENFIQKNWHKIIWISIIFSYWYIFFYTSVLYLFLQNGRYVRKSKPTSLSSYPKCSRNLILVHQSLVETG